MSKHSLFSRVLSSKDKAFWSEGWVCITRNKVKDAKMKDGFRLRMCAIQQFGIKFRNVTTFSPRPSQCNNNLHSLQNDLPILFHTCSFNSLHGDPQNSNALKVWGTQDYFCIDERTIIRTWHGQRRTILLR